MVIEGGVWARVFDGVLWYNILSKSLVDRSREVPPSAAPQMREGGEIPL